MTTTFIIIILVMLLHFIGDFVCQTEWMAVNKSKSIVPLMAHVLTYSTVLFVGLLFGGLICSEIPSLGVSVQPTFPLFFAVTNGIVHFIVDFVTSRINARLWEKKNMHNFFVGIGADQFIHAATLIGTFAVFLS